MQRIRWVFISLFAGCFLFVSIACERAQRYPALSVVSTPELKEKKPPSIPHYGWKEASSPIPQIPIVFVDAETKLEEWKQLPEFWNHFPPPTLGLPTLHFGQGPLNVALTYFAVEPLHMIKIKVPLGLPDPTPSIPAANPPTYEKWRLGQMLFHDPYWLTHQETISCTTCHKPEHGFSEPDVKLQLPEMHTPSLINCVYNKHQFWDGRATALEQVLQRQLEEEFAPPAKTSAEMKKQFLRHSWSGIVPRLSQKKLYRDAFEVVFGIPQPTTDAAAKALATYLRTILSGNSLYDQAKQVAEKKGSKKILAEHIEPLLSEKLLKSLERNSVKPAKVADEWQYGYELFFATKCYHCHSGPLFTDHSFHNIGIRESGLTQKEKEETGHFQHQPFGLKDKNMIGAFKTPSLRNLPRTPPYFHDASRKTLEDVLHFYNKQLEGYPFNNYLDPELRGDGPLDTRVFDLTPEKAQALALFLRSLDGEPIPPYIAVPLKTK